MNFNPIQSKKNYLIFIGTLNLIVFILVIKELVNLINSQNYENQLRQIELNYKSENNVISIEELNSKYNSITSIYNSDTSLVELIKFLEVSTNALNLNIIDNKALEVTDNLIIYEITVEGELQGIAELIYKIESDKKIKEIQQTEIKFERGTQVIKIIIKNYKL